jgi:hypothetical protein
MGNAQKKQAELAEKEKLRDQLKEKMGRGEVSGNGAPQMLQELVNEIARLKIELGIRDL